MKKKTSFAGDVLPLKNLLYRLALRITLSHEEAEDIVQDTFLKVWNKRNEWDNIESIEAYCLTTCRHLALDRMRSAQARNVSLDTLTAPGTSEPLLAAAPAAAWDTQPSSPLAQTQQRDRLQWVRNLVDTLPEKQRSCIQLRDFEGKSYKEVAQVLGLSEDQVKVNIFRARQIIKQRYEQLDRYGL